jgi:hypothetical protein
MLSVLEWRQTVIRPRQRRVPLRAHCRIYDWFIDAHDPYLAQHSAGTEGLTNGLTRRVPRLDLGRMISTPAAQRGLTWALGGKDNLRGRMALVQCDSCSAVHDSQQPVCPNCGRCPGCGQQLKEMSLCLMCSAPFCSGCGCCHFCGSLRFVTSPPCARK